MKMDIISELKRTVHEEQIALASVEEQIDEKYLPIIETIRDRKGKVVFTGVGKSGHIAEKLAATFSSLGTSSIFVHSTEAIHGDLGMIEKDDIVIILSNSGETSESLALIKPLEAIGAFRIAFTSKEDSSLAKKCSLTIPYIIEKEADPLNLAPTTSTTVMLAIGDSIAIVLSELTDFNKNDFYGFHPGGSLGAQLARQGK